VFCDDKQLNTSQCSHNICGYSEIFETLTLNLPTTTIVAQPFNVIKWQLTFNPVTSGLIQWLRRRTFSHFTGLATDNICFDGRTAHRTTDDFVRCYVEQMSSAHKRVVGRQTVRYVKYVH